MRISGRLTLAAAGFGALAIASGLAVAASGALQPSTQKDLEAAMKGEAFATLKYELFAAKAKADGHPELAKLFQQTADVERTEHFAEHAKLAGLVGTDAQNLGDAIGGENYETTKMYQDMAARAEAAGDTAVAKHFLEVAKDEAKHRDAFKAEFVVITTN